MKAYPEYKESGVDWINKIPSGWFISDFRRGIELLTDFEANGSFADVKKNVDLESDDNFAWYLRATDLEKGRIGIVDGNKTVDEKAYEFLSKTKLYGGELLVAKRGEIGKVYLTPKLDCKTTLAPNLYLIRLNRLINPEYSAYWFKSYYGQATLKLANKSTTIGALYKDDVKACPFVYPSAEEQIKIVSFLNFETSRIDNLIAEKENFINLLEEKQQALISHVVTKGLDDGVEMKDSGVEWIGGVPLETQVLRFRYLFNFGRGLTITKENLIEQGIKVVNYGEIHSKYNFELDTARDQLKSVDESYLLTSNDSLVTKGDFIFADTSEDLEGAGNFTHLISDEEIFAGYHTVVCRLKTKANSRYISYFLDSSAFRTQVQSVMKGVKVFSISQKVLKDTWVCLPPVEVQNEIVRFLDRQRSKINELTEETKKSIELLKEHRSALISAAVTGKIDVREEV